MSHWQEIWSKAGTSELWTIPDRQVVEIAGVWKSSGHIRRVLDVGCGIGRHAFLLAQAGFEVYGSDHSETAVARCRDWLNSAGLSGHFWCSEMDEIPYPDDFFDAVLAFNSIYHGTGETVERVTQSISSKLREGGGLFVTMPSRRSRLYGRGEEIAPHTFISPGMYDQLFEGGGERGVPHYFSSESDMQRYFSGYTFDSLVEQEFHLASLNRKNQEVIWRRVPHSYFWQLIARKHSHASRVTAQNKIAG